MRPFFPLVLIVFFAGACSETPRFRLVVDSGIEFVNHVEDTPELNIIDYLYFYDGGGVAVGDVRRGLIGQVPGHLLGAAQ